MTTRCTRWVGVAAGFVLFLVVALTANDQAVGLPLLLLNSATVSTITPSGGACPGHVDFQAVINWAPTGEGVLAVSYRWELSDGTTSAPASSTFPGTGGSVTINQGFTSALIFHGDGQQNVWVLLHVLSPIDFLSNRATFTCGSIVVPLHPISPNFTQDLTTGWNMISSIFSPVSLGALQGNCSFTGGPWWWNGSSYEPSATIDPRKGYWVKVASACTVQATATPYTPVSMDLFDGWNMISNTKSWNQMHAVGCSLLSGPWWYDGTTYQGLSPDTSMDSRKGYWVKVSGSCSVTGQNVNQSRMDSSLPPGPPEIALGPLAYVLRLLGLPQETRATPQRLMMPLAIKEVHLISVNANRVELQIEGQGIVSSEVCLYDLSGQLLVDAQGAGSQLHFMALSPNGRPLANGVYLYVVKVKGTYGQIITSEIKKLVMLR